MSIKQLNLVWQYSEHKGGPLLLLLAIADFADDAGLAYPSVDTLAKKSRMDERNVRYATKKLIDSGELVIHYNKGRKGTNLYEVTISADKQSSGWGGKSFPPEADFPGRKKTVEKGGKKQQKGGKPTSPEPSLTVIEPQQRGTYPGTKGLSTGEKNGAAAVSNLVFPDKLSSTDRDSALRLLNGTPHPQLLLDELQGVMKTKGAYNPLGLLKKFVDLDHAGSFAATHAGRVEAERELAQVQSEVSGARAENKNL